MEKQITKKLMCIVMRDGIEIWIEDDRIQNLKKALMMTEKSKFIELENEVINSADILGIFSSNTMEAKTRRKNGQWKCNWNHWHNRGERCACGEMEKYKTF